MSGGSFDYLCFADAETISEKKGRLREMADFLAGLGYAQDAARETEELLVILNQIEVRMGVRIDRLSAIWKAAEWWQSADTGEDDFKASLKEYRKEA